MRQIARRPLCPRCRHSSAVTIKWGEQFARPTTAGNGLLHFAFGSRCITPNKFPSVSLQYAKYPTVGIGVFGIISPPLLCRIFALDRAEHDPTSAHITSAVIIQENQGVGMSGQYRSNGQP